MSARENEEEARRAEHVDEEGQRARGMAGAAIKGSKGITRVNVALPSWVEATCLRIDVALPGGAR